MLYRGSRLIEWAQRDRDDAAMWLDMLAQRVRDDEVNADMIDRIADNLTKINSALAYLRLQVDAIEEEGR